MGASFQVLKADKQLSASDNQRMAAQQQLSKLQLRNQEMASELDRLKRSKGAGAPS